MSVCKDCGLQVQWVKDGRRWKCLNPDGTDHWDRCSEARTKRALAEGTAFQAADGSGVVHEGKRKYMHRTAPSIGPKEIAPWPPGKLPWED